MKNWLKKLTQGVFWKEALKIGFWGMIIEVPLFFVFLFSFGDYLKDDSASNCVLMWIYYFLIFISVLSLSSSFVARKKYKKLSRKVLVISILSLIVLIFGMILWIVI